jgi:hypothetical protein
VVGGRRNRRQAQAVRAQQDAAKAHRKARKSDAHKGATLALWLRCKSLGSSGRQFQHRARASRPCTNSARTASSSLRPSEAQFGLEKRASRAYSSARSGEGPPTTPGSQRGIGGGRSAAAAAMTAAAAQLPQPRGGGARQAGNGTHLNRQPEVTKERSCLKRRANRPGWVKGRS